MAWLTTALSLFGVFSKVGKFVGNRVSEWDERRNKLQIAKTSAKVAEIEAKRDLAVFKIKSDIEWDLKVADQMTQGWKDEFLLILWSLPLICIFIPPLRPFAMDGFDYLKEFNPDAPQWYLGGWALLFAATLGMKSLAQYMLPGKIAASAASILTSGERVPRQAAVAVQDRANKRNYNVAQR